MGPRPNPTDFTSEDAYDEAMDEFLAGPVTEAEADRHQAAAYGAEHADHAWVLSDRDCWYANPHYDGPAVPHPEDDAAWWDEGERPGANPPQVYGPHLPLSWDDEIPF